MVVVWMSCQIISHCMSSVPTVRTMLVSVRMLYCDWLFVFSVKNSIRVVCTSSLTTGSKCTGWVYQNSGISGYHEWQTSMSSRYTSILSRPHFSSMLSHIPLNWVHVHVLCADTQPCVSSWLFTFMTYDPIIIEKWTTIDPWPRQWTVTRPSIGADWFMTN